MKNQRVRKYVAGEGGAGHFRAVVLHGPKSIAPSVAVVATGDYVASIACAYCGRSYRSRLYDAHRHVEKVHGVAWWAPAEADYAI